MENWALDVIGELGMEWVLMIVADFDMIKSDEISERYLWSEIATFFVARAARNAWIFPEK